MRIILYMKYNGVGIRIGTGGGFFIVQCFELLKIFAINKDFLR